MKKTYLFPVAATIFEFLAELTCGPCKENQKTISDIINFVRDYSVVYY